MDGDCLDFKVLSDMVLGLLRKKVDDCTGQGPNQVFMMTIAARARIGAAYNEYAKVYVEALRSHLKKHGLYGHSFEVRDASFPIKKPVCIAAILLTTPLGHLPHIRGYLVRSGPGRATRWPVG